jgi:predicted alpha/beta-hydrolase family hydrolase
VVTESIGASRALFNIVVTLPTILRDGVPGGRILLILAHGAGLPMDAPFMTKLVELLLATPEVEVWRFEFPYMEARRHGGSKRPPDRPAILTKTWVSVVELSRSEGRTHIVCGGKSMGGRIASMVVDDLGASGLVCLGYPFHPKGKPEKLRTEHLTALRTPTLICQGERDGLGTWNEVNTYDLSPNIEFHWSIDGDHDLKPRKTSGSTHDANLSEAVSAISRFLRSLELPSKLLH